jgi:hypothetical protein
MEKDGEMKFVDHNSKFVPVRDLCLSKLKIKKVLLSDWHEFIFINVMFLFQMDIEKYPAVTVSRDQTHNLSQRENVKSAFIPAERTAWQRAFLAW